MLCVELEFVLSFWYWMRVNVPNSLVPAETGFWHIDNEEFQAQYLFLIIKVGWMVGCKASIVLFMARRHSSMDWSAPLIM